MHHVDTMLLGINDILRVVRLTIQDEAAAISFVNTSNYFNHSRLACAIFTNEYVNLTSPHVETDIINCDNAWEFLCQVRDF